MNIAQRSLSRGEIAPALYARTDLAQYQTAVRTMRNFIVKREGGATNRPGTQFITEIKDSTRTVRLVKFVFNSDQTYVLEFGHQYIRFVRDGAQLMLGGFPYEIATSYAESDLMELQFVQSADVITIVHQSYAPAELSRTGHTAWTLTPIVFGPSIGSVTNLAMAGGSAGGPTYYAVTAIDSVTGEEGLPTFVNDALEPSEANPITLTWDPLTGAETYNVYRSIDGSTYELLDASGGVPTTQTDTTWTSDTSDVNTTTQDTWIAAVTQARNPVIAGGVNKPFNNRFTINGAAIVEVSGSGMTTSVDGRYRAYYSRDGETRVDAGIIFSNGASGDASATVVTNYSAFNAAVVVPDNGYTALTIDIVPEVNGSSDNVGDIFVASVDFTLAASNSITWSIIGTGFSDDGSEGDPLQTPPIARPLFDHVNGYPSATTIYQQRRIFANTIEAPETAYASRTGAYKNFLISRPLQDDDAVTWSMAGRQVNAIKHLLDLGRLITFTTGSEMTVEGDEAGILRPDAINPRKFSAHGIGRLAPIEVSTGAMYVQARQTRVKNIIPNGDSYNTTDLTLWAAHLFDGYTVEDWDFAENPFSVAWAVRSDGVLLGLTYLPDQEISGWHRHDTDGVIERVCVVPEDSEDRVYIVVKRTIDGTDKRYIERLFSRFKYPGEFSIRFMDSSLSYSGVPADVISGLDHLEGKAVAVTTATGEVIASPNNDAFDVITVVGGEITLPAEYPGVHVGLPYLSDLETLDIDTPQGRSVKESKILVNKVNISLEESREFFIGGRPPVTDALEGLSEWSRDIEDDASPAPLTKTIDVAIENDWNKSGRVFLRVVDPVPVTVLAVIPQGYL